MNVAILICLGVTVTVAAIWIERQRVSVRHERFKMRQFLDPIVIYQTHYAHLDFNQADFISFWERIGEALKIDCRLLRPSDRFDVELAAIKGFPVVDELQELEAFFEDEFRKRHPDKAISKIASLDEMTKLLLERSSTLNKED